MYMHVLEHVYKCVFLDLLNFCQRQNIQDNDTSLELQERSLPKFLKLFCLKVIAEVLCLHRSWYFKIMVDAKYFWVCL